MAIDFLFSALNSIGNVTSTVAQSAMVWNQKRLVDNQSKAVQLMENRDGKISSHQSDQIELARDRDQNSQDMAKSNRKLAKKLARERMQFEAQMEMVRQASRAKERQEEREFTLTLKEMELEHLFKTEQMRQAFQSMRDEEQRQLTEAIEKFKAEIQIAINKENLAFARWKEETGRQFAIEMKLLDIEINRLLSREARENAQRDRSSPIHGVVEDILSVIASYERPPLCVFISPPVIRFDPSPKGGGDPQFPMIESILKASLRDLFEKYSQNNRSIMFLAGEWISKVRGGESAARDLFRDLKTAPVMILETEVEESFLNINLGFWTGSSIDLDRFKTVVRKLRWRDGLDVIYSEKAKEFEGSGRSVNQASPSELDRLARRSREKLAHYLEVLHCVHAGMVADEYFLLYSEPRQLPLLPQLLPDLLAEEPLPAEVQVEMIHRVIDYCAELFNVLARTEHFQTADLRLEWVLTLVELPGSYGLKSQVHAAVKHWLRERGYSEINQTLNELCTTISRYLIPEDKQFVDRLNLCLEAIGEGETMWLDIVRSCYHRASRSMELGEYDNSLIDLDRALKIDPDYTEAIEMREDIMNTIGQSSEFTCTERGGSGLSPEAKEFLQRKQKNRS